MKKQKLMILPLIKLVANATPLTFALMILIGWNDPTLHLNSKEKLTMFCFFSGIGVACFFWFGKSASKTLDRLVLGPVGPEMVLGDHEMVEILWFDLVSSQMLVKRVPFYESKLTILHYPSIAQLVSTERKIVPGHRYFWHDGSFRSVMK